MLKKHPQKLFITIALPPILLYFELTRSVEEKTRFQQDIELKIDSAIPGYAETVWDFRRNLQSFIHSFDPFASSREKRERSWDAEDEYRVKHGFRRGFKDIHKSKNTSEETELS